MANNINEYLDKNNDPNCDYYVPDICNLNNGERSENDKDENYKINYDGSGNINNISTEKLAELDYLFILESPHTDEVAKGYPLARDSGRAVSKYLFGDETPLGELIHDNDDTLLCEKKIAIINVSNVPLQVIDKNKSDISEIVGDLEKIRNNAINEKNDGTTELYEQFKNKMENFKIDDNEKLTIITCGEFANKYYNKYIKESNISIEPLYVPHPSRGHWQFIDKHQQNLHELKDKFTPKNGNKK